MRFVRASLLLSMVFTGVAFPAHAIIPRLSLPIHCSPGRDCFIQHYFDHELAPGIFRDYRCGNRGYDGHHGTDFRVRHLGQLAGEGVDVLAAAPGTVSQVFRLPKAREDMTTLDMIFAYGESQSGCGAGVEIDHGTGWKVYYCHMDNDSLRVRKGEKVETGQLLGKMGMTGGTEFPHVHLEVKHYGQSIDPFMGRGESYSCEQEKRYPLWTAEALEQLSYNPAGVIMAGIAGEEPDIASLRQSGAPPLPPVAPQATLVIWAETYGLQKGDRIDMRFVTPLGETVLHQTWQQETDIPVQFLQRAAPAPAEGWREGRYTARLRATRDAVTIMDYVWDMQVTPQ